MDTTATLDQSVFALCPASPDFPAKGDVIPPRSQPSPTFCATRAALHTQKFQRLAIVGKPNWSSDVAHVLLLVIDPQLFVNGRDEIGNLNRVVPDEHAFFI